MKKPLIINALIITVLVMVSCSTLPREKESPVLQEANHFYRLGKQYANERELENALQFFSLAHDGYQSIDNQKGVILSKIELIGTIARMGKSVVPDDDLASLEYYIQQTKPQYISHLLLLRAELAYMRDDHEKVVNLTEGYKKSDLLIDSQITGYRLLSLLELGQPASQEYDNLRRFVRALQRNYRKQRSGDDGVYSYISYILGYYEMKNENWDRAEPYFLASLAADKDADDSYGAAQNLYSLGRVYHALDDHQKARIHYIRAKHIYELLQEEQIIEIIRTELNDLAPYSPEE